MVFEEPVAFRSHILLSHRSAGYLTTRAGRFRNGSFMAAHA